MSCVERVTVTLALARVDQDVLRHARLVRDLGAGKTLFSFVHFLATADGGDNERRAARSPAEAVAAIRDAVAAHFGETGAEDVRVLSGSSLDALLESVETAKADLLLVGRRRDARGLRATGRRLAMKAPCSVWMVPEGSPARISGVLVATDFSQPSADAVAMATRIARRAGLATCSVLHVRQPERQQPERASAQNPWRAFESFLRPLDLCGLDVRELVAETGSVADAMARNAESLPADLAVIGSRRNDGSADALRGGESDFVLRQSKVPVLVTKANRQTSGSSTACFS